MANIAIDFDGTCVVALPEPGISNVDTGAERVIKKLQAAGHNIILWTCRNHSEINPYNYINEEFREENDSLDEAVEWFRSRGIHLSGINEVPGETDIIGKSRKALYDILIDDVNMGSQLVYGQAEYVCLETGEIKVANAHSIDWNWVESECYRFGLLT